MDIFVGAFLVFAFVITAMAVGVIFSDRRLKGSCGGLSTWKDGDGRPVCEACADCPEKKKECELELASLSDDAGNSGDAPRI